MDVLVPRMGEIIGGSQREDNYELLYTRMQELGIDPNEYAWYLDLRRFGSTPHSGFGLGLERFLQYITGIANIRDAIAFPRVPVSSALVLMLPSFMEAKMLFSEFEKEVHSPYKDSIVPNYDVTIDGSRSVCPPPSPCEQELNLTTIEIINVEEEVKDKDKKQTKEAQEKEKAPVSKKEEKNKPATNKLMQVEVYPSSTIRYPEEHYTPAKVNDPSQEKSFSSTSLHDNQSSKQMDIKSNTPRENNISNMKTQEWFIVVKASRLLQDLENDQKKLQKLFKSIPAKIHEEDSYYFLMLGPSQRDNIGIIMKILEHNNYRDATTVLAR
ncbi:UNVERIFIED_CONTAM: hypothetical protein PYX00_011942 [Menopon gallinae]|uniref:Aminoacyl-tRNA synthetase class II (D/K/N) domain-containing protein n=1 Tax=Menopon gallinae TaxID=328185 RepID=A0AAW2H945_9NEOP